MDETFPFEFGLDTELNESKLSIRQKRLLCLARALLKRSKILVLDEALTDLDEE